MVGGYTMVGIPDGLGAFNGPNNKFTLLMNHELSDTAGIVRANGFKGAFVSRWEIENGTLAVTNGRDLNTSPADVFWYSQPAARPQPPLHRRPAAAERVPLRRLRHRCAHPPER